MSRWIRLKSMQFIRRKPYRAGEWVCVGNQLAERLIEQGEADSGPMITAEIAGDAGVIYAVYGDAALKEARDSVKSVKGLHPGLSIVIISDNNPGIKGTQFIYHEDTDPGARTAKLATYELSPFQRTLYLDADTVAISSLASGFNLLRYFDVALAIDLTTVAQGVLAGMLTYTEEERLATREALPTPHLTQYACGAIFFRKSDETARLFQAWRAEWLRFQWRDQGAFLRALYRTPIRYVALPTEWNVSGRRREAMVIHHRWGAARRPGQG